MLDLVSGSDMRLITSFRMKAGFACHSGILMKNYTGQINSLLFLCHHHKNRVVVINIKSFHQKLIKWRYWTFETLHDLCI